jgi:outer membrane protein assembly factor BamB
VRRRLVYAAAGILVLLVAAGTAAYLYRKHQGRDIRGSSTVEFVEQNPKAVKEPKDVTWPLYGYDPARLRAPFGLKVHPPFRRAPVWTFRGGRLLEFPPVIAYGRIYIVNNAGTLFALTETRGKPVWKYSSHRCSAASPAVGQHLVFISLLNKPPCNAAHGVDGKLIAFDAETGRIRWQRTIGPSESSPLLSDKLVIVGDWSHNVYAFTAATGNLRWQASSQPRIGRTGTFYANPAVAYGRVYIGATDGKMYSFGATSGKLRWSNGTGDFIYSSAAVWRQNVLVGSYDGTFYSFDAATGDVRWRFSAGGKISGSPSVIDGTVYFSTLSGRTFGLNASNGKRVFSYPAGEYAAAVASKHRLYLVGYSRLYALIRRGGERGS